MCFIEIGLCTHNMLIILGSIVNMIGVNYMTLNEYENVHFDNEKDIHMSSETCETNVYGNELDLLII